MFVVVCLKEDKTFLSIISDRYRLLAALGIIFVDLVGSKNFPRAISPNLYLALIEIRRPLSVHRMDKIQKNTFPGDNKRTDPFLRSIMLLLV